MIKTILFASDLSAFTGHALLHVEDLARQYNANIVVVHAIQPVGQFARALIRSRCPDERESQFLSAALLENLREEMYELFIANPCVDSELIARIGDIIVEEGAPACVILKHAEKVHADLIVVGSHSTDAVDGRILGSVADKVLQLAKVPVFMVPMANPVIKGDPQLSFVFRSSG